MIQKKLLVKLRLEFKELWKWNFLLKNELVEHL